MGCVPGLPFPQPHQAWAGRPLLFTMELGFPGDQPQPNPTPLASPGLTHTGRRGGGWVASWTPAPFAEKPPSTAGPGRKKQWLPLEEVGIQGLPARVGARTQEN